MEVRIADCPLGAKCEEVKVVDGKQIIFRCPWYVRVRRIDNNTGDELDQFSCAIAWMPTLMINTANEARKGAAATESFRNEMVEQGEQTQKLMLLASQLARPNNVLQEREICE
jgi:hypothetical protein